MPKLACSVRKNNKTYFTNLSDIAKALHRPELEILKWFGYTLGSSVNSKDFALNGKYDEAELQNYLQQYINDYILCATCNNPETTYSVVDKRIIRKCKACSAESPVHAHPKLKKDLLRGIR
jgi:translation initiation factor 5